MAAQVSQPITQLVQIGLRHQERRDQPEIERTRVRGYELTIVNSIKRTASRCSRPRARWPPGTRRLRSTASCRARSKTASCSVALRADALDVEFRLAQEELSQVKRRNQLASQKEQLNQLLGRDVRTLFEVAAAAAAIAIDVNLEAAERQALASRPDVREAQRRSCRRRLPGASPRPIASRSAWRPRTRRT